MSAGCLHIRFSPDQKDIVISALLDQGIESFQEGGFAEGQESPIPDEHTLITCYFLDLLIASEHQAALADQLPPETQFELVELLDLDWQEAWKEFSAPTTISPHLLVRASYHEVTLTPGQQEIIIDSTLAFGTGSHPTTKMSLAFIETCFANIATAPNSVLDVGCGTGVLAIASDLFGATSVLGIDIEEEAIKASATNATLNAAECCQFSVSPLAEVPGTFDLVIANILSSTILLLWPELCAHTTPGGTLFISGLLESEETNFLQQIDLPPSARYTKDGWLSLVFRPAPQHL